MDRGGAELRTLDLMAQAALKGFEFHFATLADGAGSLDTTIEALNGKVHSCPLSPLFPFRFRQLIRVHAFDVVHSHVHHFSGYILRLAALEGTGTRIAHFRSTGDGQPGTWRRLAQRAIMTRWIDRYATAIVAVGEGVMNLAWRPNWRSDPRCVVVYSGLDLDRFAGAPDPVSVRREFGMPEDSRLIIHVGSISSSKNQIRLLRIFAELSRRNPGLRLLLVGRDPDGARRGIVEAVADLNLQEVVTFAGERSDIVRLLKASNLMIFPSLREGLPGAVLEACAAGTPVVASDLPGVREIATTCPSVTCLPLAAPDEEWAAAAERVLKCRSVTTTLNGGCFDASTTACRIRELYEVRPA
jgi:glycosyltransferase involved in cell wall biosynthesis